MLGSEGAFRKVPIFVGMLGVCVERVCLEDVWVTQSAQVCVVTTFGTSPTRA